MEDHTYVLPRKRETMPPNKRKRSDKRGRDKTQVNIGVAYSRWKELLKEKDFTRDAEVAWFLLDSMRTTTASKQPVQLSSESSDSDIEEESLFGPHSSRRRPRNNQPSQRSTVDLWANTGRPCEAPIRRGSDRELQAFISMRDQTDKATEEWEKLNYDIHTLRYARREVRSRWRKILLQLGYQCEVDALLCVNRQSWLSRDEEHLNKATELLKELLDHTSLFPPETEQTKYLCVMDRLVSLDSAEDFVRLAKEKYPKKEG